VDKVIDGSVRYRAMPCFKIDEVDETRGPPYTSVQPEALGPSVQLSPKEILVAASSDIRPETL
jgi:hypothetical protein